MADRKISDLTALTTPASGDYLPIVDISEAAASDKNKRITIEELMRGVPDGTVGAPGIAFESDPNTGIYSPGADQIAVATNGQGRLFVDASGNVGVGVASPERPIHLPDGNVLLLGTTAATGTQIAHSASGNLTINNKEAGAQIFFTNDTERLRITSTGQLSHIGGGSSGSPAVGFNGSAPSNSLVVDSLGKVGIGTSAPDGLLTVRPTSGNAQVFIRTNDTTSTSQLIFGDSADSNVGGLQYNHTTDSLQFHVGNIGEKMTLDSLGKLGIGTTSPAATLEVNGDTGLIVHPTTASTTGQIQIAGTRVSGAAAVATVNLKAIPENPGGDSDASSFAIETRAVGGAISERARIDSSGRLLVGTSTARSNFFGGLAAASQVEGSTTNTASISITRNDAGADTPYLILGHARGTGNQVVSANDGLGRISFQGADGTKFVQAAQIGAFVDGTPGADDMPGRLEFSTAADGASSPTERMRIRSNGVIATLSPTGSDCLSVGAATGAGTSNYFYAGTHSRTSILGGGTLSYGVFTNGNVVNTNNSYGAISDIKLKENIVDANSQWDDLKALQVRNYNFKEGQTHTQIGLIAQEVELASPGLVSESPDLDEDGNDLGTVTKSVNYSVLYMKAVKALQEAMERIETLEQRLNDAGIN